MRVEIAADKIRVLEDLLMERNRYLDSAYLKFGKGFLHPLYGGLPVLPPYDQFTNQGIIKG